MKDFLIVVPTLAAIATFLAVIVLAIFGVGWGVSEMEAHYSERQYQFEWELQQRTISALLDSAEILIQRIKE